MASIGREDFDAKQHRQAGEDDLCKAVTARLSPGTAHGPAWPRSRIPPVIGPVDIGGERTTTLLVSEHPL